MAHSNPPVARKPFWVAVAIAGVFTIILSFPRRETTEPESILENPEERAEELINGLVSRLGSDSIEDTAPPMIVPEPGPPVRDLFATVRTRPIRPADTASGASRPVSPRMPATPSLGGLLTDGERRLAILNGETVGEGDTVAGYRVRAIEANAVVLEWRGKTKRVKWKD
jgi:hypothetical protein